MHTLMHMCICMRMRMCMCLRMCMCMCMCIRENKHKRAITHKHTNIDTRTYMRPPRCMCEHGNAPCARTHSHIHTACVHTHTPPRTPPHRHTNIHRACVHIQYPNKHTHKNTNAHAQTRAIMNTHMPEWTPLPDR